MNGISDKRRSPPSWLMLRECHEYVRVCRLTAVKDALVGAARNQRW